MAATKWIFVPKGLDELHIFKYHATEISWTALKILKCTCSQNQKFAIVAAATLGKTQPFWRSLFIAGWECSKECWSKLRLTQKTWFQQRVSAKRVEGRRRVSVKFRMHPPMHDPEKACPRTQNATQKASNTSNFMALVAMWSCQGWRLFRVALLLTDMSWCLWFQKTVTI